MIRQKNSRAQHSLCGTDNSQVDTAGKSIEDLLSYHGRLEGEEQTIMLDMLTWQLTSIGTEAR